MSRNSTRRTWLASTLLLPAGAALLAQEKKPERIDLDDLKKRVDQKQPDLFFLDVREPQEIEELGSLKGYVNIPVGQVEARLNEIPKDRFIVSDTITEKTVANAAVRVTAAPNGLPKVTLPLTSGDPAFTGMYIRLAVPPETPAAAVSP